MRVSWSAIVFVVIAFADLIKADSDRGDWLCHQVEHLAEQSRGHNVIGFLEGLVQYEITPPWPYKAGKIGYPEGCEKAYTFSRTVGKEGRTFDQKILQLETVGRTLH